METIQTPHVSKAAWWTGIVLSVVPSLFLLSGLPMVFAMPEMVRQGMAKQGYPESVAMPLILVEFVCAVLYLIPQTAVLGAILLTGWLGGAVATHVRASEWSQFPFAFCSASCCGSACICATPEFGL